MTAREPFANECPCERNGLRVDPECARLGRCKDAPSKEEVTAVVLAGRGALGKAGGGGEVAGVAEYFSKCSPSEIAAIRTLWAAHHTGASIARALGRPRGTISSWCHKLGLEKRRPGRRVAIAKATAP